MLVLCFMLCSFFACNENNGDTGDNQSGVTDDVGGSTDGSVDNDSSNNDNGGSTGDDNNDNVGDGEQEEPSVHKHNFICKVATEEYLAESATCTQKAQYYYSCECGEYDFAVFEYGEYGHIFDDKECILCRERIVSNIFFGQYPQTIVVDEQTTASLLALAGDPLIDTSDWTNYGYYENGIPSDCMYYKDVDLNGEKYRGVFIKRYRPYLSNYGSADWSNSQLSQGYLKESVYWFKYEPLEWVIINEEQDGSMFLVCNSIIDSQEFDYKEGDKFSNNYAISLIRVWLNYNFYNTAFNAEQKSKILVTEVDNSSLSTGLEYNQYACENTFDRVFLLSYADLDSYMPVAKMRQKGETDYAICQGASTPEGGYGYWWLRSPDDKRDDLVATIYPNGEIYYDYYTDFVVRNYVSVVPAIRVNFNEHKHSFVNEIAHEEYLATSPTCDQRGQYFYTCDCGAIGTEVFEYGEYGHIYDEKECILCRDRVVRYIYFGEYPQTEVTDEELTANLLAMAGDPLIDTSNWINYGYYENGARNDCMYYKDVEFGDDRYRGVFIKRYRPYLSNYPSTTWSNFQMENGYLQESVYWFKFEPIEWTVIDENETQATLICSLIIDSQEFDYKEGDKFSNNYAESLIRAWLNDNFYNTAFNAEQKEKVLVTEVDNSVASTGFEENEFACENTFDKVFLLSYADIGAYMPTNRMRIKSATDYALIQGCSAVDGIGMWWLRSPDNSIEDLVPIIYPEGEICYDYYFDLVARNFVSVAPSITIKLS